MFILPPWPIFTFTPFAMSQNQLDKKSEAWSALFSEPMSDLVKRYTSSVFFDKRLWQADIEGSLAHALHAQGAGHALAV